MQQHWRKLGKLFPRDEDRDVRCAAVPIAEHLHGDTFRIYFSNRDVDNRSFLRSLEIRVGEHPEILAVSTQNLLAAGSPGLFDDAGAMATCLLKTDSETRMYYIGWNLGVKVPFRNALGVAIRDEKTGLFNKISDGPIVDRSIVDPYFVASCDVRFESGLYRLWYLSCTGWEQMESGLRHRYLIKYAESADGLEWNREGLVAIPFAYAEEYAISVPRVIRDPDCYRMWFSSRARSSTATYRIGYAESADGIHWQRKDEAVSFDVTPGDWDSEMLCYPFIFDHAGRRYMLYNGNGYGRSGFGLAILEN
jgi:hypothetical protein